MPNNIIDAADSNHSFKRGLVIDAGAGALAGLFTTPFETIKKRVESGQQWWFGFNPNMAKQTYRGASAFIFSVSPVTAVQGIAARYIQNNYNHGGELQIGQMLVSGGIGGFVSAFTENVILRQQKLKSGPKKAIETLFKQSLFRPWLGLSALLFREVVFGTSYMSKDRIEKNFGFIGVLLLGATGSLASHPFDRIATEKQNLDLKESLFKTAKRIYDDGGMRNLYKGGAWRIGLFTGCMVIIAEVKKACDSEHPKTPTLS